MQQTLSGCAFCDARPGSELGDARTWGTDEIVAHPICTACARQATLIPRTATDTRAIAVDWLSTPFRPVPRSECSSAISKGQSASARGVLRMARRRIGRKTSSHISSSNGL